MTKLSGWKTGFLLVVLCARIAHAGPTINLSKKTGPPTSGIRVSGSGFEPNIGVDIYFDMKDEVLVVTNDNGEFHNARIHTPSNAHPGEHWITALERNNDKGDQKPFVVNTNWSQFDFEADGTRLNPYENSVNADNVQNLNLKWSFLTDGANAYSPAVVDGVVYCTGNEFFYAINAQTGALLWSVAAANPGT